MKLKKSLNEENNTPTLNAYLARAGVCSRRNAVMYIEYRRVAVNGKVVTEPGYRVQPTDTITVDGEVIGERSYVYIILNKPSNYITTLQDEEGRRTVIDLLGRIEHRVFPVGRLDRNTTGVLLLTNDGDLANTLAHPRFGVQKKYEVKIDRVLEYSDEQKLKRGIMLEDGFIRFDEVTPISDTVIHLVLHSGKNRVLRRVFDQLDYRIVSLHRISYAGLTADGLQKGAWRYLTKQEVELLKLSSQKRRPDSKK